MTSPYQPPQAELSEPVCAGGYTYVPQDGKVRLLSAALAIYGCITLIGVVSDVMEIELLFAIERGEVVSNADADASDVRQGLIGIGQAGVYLVTAICFCSFIYRANANARALGGALHTTPGWAVGWFFVPVLNLFKPYQAYKEIWIQSDPVTLEAGLPPGTAILKLWWGLWLISNLAGQAVARSAMGNASASALISAGYIQLASDTIELPLTLLALAVVRELHARQVRWYDQRLGTSA